MIEISHEKLVTEIDVLGSLKVVEFKMTTCVWPLYHSWLINAFFFNDMFYLLSSNDEELKLIACSDE